jgi:hypothetical protein
MLTPIKSKFMSNYITGSKGHRYRAISWALCRGMDAKKNHALYFACYGDGRSGENASRSNAI